MQLVVTAARVTAVAGRYGSRSTAATTVATTRVTTLVLASVVGVVLVVVILLHVTVVGRGHTLDFLAVLVGGSGTSLDLHISGFAEDRMHLENENKSIFILHFTRFSLSLH